MMNYVCGDHWEIAQEEMGDPFYEGCPFCHIAELKLKIELAKDILMNEKNIEKALSILNE